ncbi:helix-turn-helix domain-containing protein [Kibdelosporangium philippinense]|nr:helix-turn-helix domain-containing protein [Kibdelosporangium philippinense]
MLKRRTYTCGLDAALDVMGGKWKALILWELTDGPQRFGQLRRQVDDMSERVLILQLRELEACGLVHRELYHQVPPRVEYSLTDLGQSLIKAMIPLGEWGEQNMATIESLGRGD